MKKFLLASSALLAVCGSAPAAEMPLKAPRYAPPPATVADWTGPYLGLALGGKWADTTWNTTSVSDATLLPVDASSPRSYRPSGFRVGGYAGYNWQVANWVWGLEADAAWTDATTTAAGIPGCAIECFPGAPGPGVDTTSLRVSWDTSARARLGFLLTPTLLLYGTGGVAWQSIEVSGTCQHSLADPACTRAPGSPFDTRSASRTLAGTTFGGGLEALYGNWLLRAEYRYTRLADWNVVFDFQAAGVPPGEDTSRFRLATETHIATFGVAYKFGAPVYSSQ
jgi:outer membrane immunogenic protein